MNKSEIQMQMNLTYAQQIEYLKKKYGPAKENYFLDEACTKKSTKNGRGKEGLFLHHDLELDPNNMDAQNLSKPEVAQIFGPKYQECDKLTYCNYLEHLLLHTKISVARTNHFKVFRPDGIMEFMIPELNDMYAKRIKLIPWKQIAFNLIADNYKEYSDIIIWWLFQCGIDGTKLDWQSLSFRAQE